MLLHSPYHNDKVGQQGFVVNEYHKYHFSCIKDQLKKAIKEEPYYMLIFSEPLLPKTTVMMFLDAKIRDIISELTDLLFASRSNALV